MTVEETAPALEPTGAPTVVRSEEQVTVSMPVRVSGGLRLEKYVVTETVTQTVEVRREHLRVVELGVDDLVVRGAVADVESYQLHDREFEMILHEERVVVTTEVVPVERVRVRTRVVAAPTPVTATVRREQIDLTASQSAPTHG